MRSRRFGFVEFARHEHALYCLRKLNNNPDVFTPDARPIVEFALEDQRKLLLRRKRLEKQQKLKEMAEAKKKAEEEAKKPFEGQCFRCRKVGHKTEDCPELKKEKEAKEKEKQQQQQQTANGQQKKDPRLAKAKCYRCKQKGHTIQMCTWKPPFDGTCYNCEQKGHRGTECPLPPQPGWEERKQKAVEELKKKRAEDPVESIPGLTRKGKDRIRRMMAKGMTLEEAKAKFEEEEAKKEEKKWKEMEERWERKQEKARAQNRLLKEQRKQERQQELDAQRKTSLGANEPGLGDEDEDEDMPQAQQGKRGQKRKREEQQKKKAPELSEEDDDEGDGFEVIDFDEGGKIKSKKNLRGHEQEDGEDDEPAKKRRRGGDKKPLSKRERKELEGDKKFEKLVQEFRAKHFGQGKERKAPTKRWWEV